MKIVFPCDSSQTLGGGFTFRRNLIKGLRRRGCLVVEDIKEADIALVAGTTMVTRETINKIIQSKAKLIVRLDNVPRNSRNRNTGTSRLKEFSERADAIVWQCKWARNYLKDFIKPKFEKIIYNGVDDEIFTSKGDKFEWNEFSNCNEIYMYSRFSRDETKNWEVAWYKYQLIQRKNPNAGLVIVGKFSPEQMEYKFDFFRGERYIYIPTIADPKIMAKVYRSVDKFLATYWNDCYSNTYCEALACGVELYEPNMSGGTPELIKNGPICLDEMTDNYISFFKEVMER